jgi:hypothetical protein
MFLRVFFPNTNGFSVLDFPIVDQEVRIKPELARVYKGVIDVGKTSTGWSVAFPSKTIEEIVSTAIRVEIVFQERPLVVFDSWSTWQTFSNSRQTNVKHFPDWLLEGAKRVSAQLGQHMYQFIIEATLEKLATAKDSPVKIEDVAAECGDGKLR